MARTSSRLGPGTLTFGDIPTEFGCQVTACKLVPSTDEEDGLPTLCEPAPAPELTTKWSLEGTVEQDWELEATEGFVEYCRVNDGATVAFEFVPNTDIGVKYAGSCQVRAVEIGGDIATRITTDFEFPVVGDITRTKAP